MNVVEAYKEVNVLGKAGALTMAGGLLALTVALGLEITNDTKINNQALTEVPSEVNVTIGLTGAALNLAGLKLLIVGSRRSRVEQEKL